VYRVAAVIVVHYINILSAKRVNCTV